MAMYESDKDEWKLLGIMTSTSGTLTIPQDFRELWICPILDPQFAGGNFSEVRLTNDEFYRRLNLVPVSLSFIFNTSVTHDNYTNTIHTTLNTIVIVCNKSRVLSIAYAKTLPNNSQTVTDLTGYQVPVYYR